MAFTEGQTLDNMLGSLFVGSLLAGVYALLFHILPFVILKPLHREKPVRRNQFAGVQLLSLVL